MYHLSEKKNEKEKKTTTKKNTKISVLVLFGHSHPHDFQTLDVIGIAMVHIFISPDLYIPDKQFHPLSFLALLFNPGCWVLPNNKLTHNTNVLLSRTLSAFKL